MMYVESERLILRDMLLPDLEQMQQWRPFSNPLSPTWNIHWRNIQDMEGWLGRLKHDASRRIYAITLKDGTVIGRLSLRHIYTGQHAVLGIALGADWVGSGYGTEALQAFMPYFFDVLHFDSMWLDVAAPNLRAVKCYEKVGFVRTREQFRSVTSGEARAFRSMPEYAELSSMLTQQNGRCQMLFYDMELTRDEWRRRQESGKVAEARL
jgi:RimJ/RimL family protein N-acetyltransferase